MTTWRAYVRYMVYVTVLGSNTNAVIGLGDGCEVISVWNDIVICLLQHKLTVRSDLKKRAGGAGQLDFVFGSHRRPTFGNNQVVEGTRSFVFNIRPCRIDDAARMKRNVSTVFNPESIKGIKVAEAAIPQRVLYRGLHTDL